MVRPLDSSDGRQIIARAEQRSTSAGALPEVQTVAVRSCRSGPLVGRLLELGRPPERRWPATGSPASVPSARSRVAAERH